MAKKSETVEATETETVATETETTETVIDLAAFETAVTEAIGEVDETTGTIPEAYVAKVRAEYQALPGAKPKNAAREVLSNGLKEQMGAGNLPGARGYMQLTDEAAVASRGSASTAKPVDPAEAFREHVAAVTLAGFLVTQAAPEGVDAATVVAEGQALAQELYTEGLLAAFNGEEGAPEVEGAVAKTAVRLAASKVRKGPGARSGERRDLGAHIQAAFDSVEPGTFLTVAQVRKFDSGIYGSDLPSAGAITNRLQPKSGKETTIEGIVVETRDGKLGAVKQ